MTDEYPVGPLQKLARREFDDPDVRKMLAGLDLSSLISKLGHPETSTQYAEPRGSMAPGTGWQQGEPLPSIQDEDPALIQAVARCATAELQRSHGFPVRALHDGRRCAWCAPTPDEHGVMKPAFPLSERLAACDLAVFRSRFVVVEFAIWHADPDTRRGATYQRTVRQDEYDNPAFREFWALPVAAREARIVAAQYPEGVTA